MTERQIQFVELISTVSFPFLMFLYIHPELDYLIYNDPVVYADLILNGDPETYLKTVTEYKPLDS